MKRWQSVLLLLAGLIVAFCSYVFLQLRTIEVERLDDDLWVLRGLGGNTAVLRTDAGAVVVDTEILPLQGKRIRQLAQIGTTATEKGMSLKQTLATDQLTEDAGYRRNRMIVPLPMDRDFVITRAWVRQHRTGSPGL